MSKPSQPTLSTFLYQNESQSSLDYALPQTNDSGFNRRYLEDIRQSRIVWMHLESRVSGHRMPKVMNIISSFFEICKIKKLLSFGDAILT